MNVFAVLRACNRSRALTVRGSKIRLSTSKRSNSVTRWSPELDTTGTITSFSPIPKTRGVTIGGDIYGVHTAGKSYSLTNPDSQTLQFTIQPGDAGPYDTSGSVDRSEICAANAGPGGVQDIPVGTPIGIDYQFMVQPNGPNNTFTNTASWFVTGEMHNDDSVSGVATSPPFAIQLAGNHLQVVARYCPPGGNPGNGAGSNMVNMVLWTDPNPIVPGRYYDINIQSKLSNTGAGGYLDVSIDGKQVVNYSGPLGYGAGTYWMDGLYRNAGPTQTVTDDFRNFTMVTGSTAIGWKGVDGTTSSSGTTTSTGTSSGSTSSSTTPTVTPAVTQATASPATGIEHAGDTITLSLAFNEAVTVTGTPTLSLNDGGTATYVGGSGTGTLTFKTTVASTNTSTSALAITGVNVPSGAAIKDASGVAANLAGAVKTFSGLQIDPTSTTPTAPTTPTTPTTPSVATPVLTIADNSLWVAGRGGTVDLGAKVTTTDSNDVVTVNITGLPKYETITDKLDGQTFRGNNITLTAAQVDSGLELHSYYRGGGHPTATLTLTASAKDPTTGAVAMASPQSITVVDPRPEAATTTTSSHHHHTATDQQPVATTTAAAPTTSQTIEPTDHQQAAAANTGFLASRGFALLQQHFDPAASTLATTAAHPTMPADHPAATGTTMASFASQSFALLNQYLAAHTGQVDPGQIVAAVSQATGWGHDSLLARPQH